MQNPHASPAGSTRRMGADKGSPVCNCCFGLLVDVTGADVHRLARSLHLDPATLVTTCGSDELDDDLGFCLEPGGQTFLLVLRQRGATRPRCALLIGPLGGTQATRCGVYADRPMACRAYPAELAFGREEETARVRRRSIARCPVDAFGATPCHPTPPAAPATQIPKGRAEASGGADPTAGRDARGPKVRADAKDVTEATDASDAMDANATDASGVTDAMDDAVWRPQIRDEQLGIDLYRIVTWRWNRHVLAANRRFRLAEFLRYLLDVYDRLAPLSEQLATGPDWSAQREAWGGALDDGTSPFLAPARKTPELGPIRPTLHQMVTIVEGSFPADPW